MTSAVPWIGSSGANAAIFSAPLITSAVPDRALGSSTPTFTRATTKSIVDFEGLYKPILANEVGFSGARRVQNLATTAIVYINATQTASGQAGYNGSSTAFRVRFDSALVYGIYKSATSGVQIPAGGAYVVSMAVCGYGASIGKVIGFGTYDGTTVTPVNITLSSSWQRVSFLRTGAAGSSDVRCGVLFGGSFGGSGSTVALNDEILVDAFQIENVTGQTNQNPSEYVSVGVLSSPFHGACVDGVKYFSTLNGNTVASNVVTEATGAAINSSQGACAGGVTAKVVDASGPVGYNAEPQAINVLLQSNTLDNASWTVSNAADMNAVVADQYVSIDGTTTMDKLQPKNTTAVHSLDQAFTFTAAVYTLSGTLRYVSATPQRYVALVLNDGTTTWAASFDLSTGTAGAVSNCTSTMVATAQANVYKFTMTKSAAAAAAAGTVKISLNATDTATLESALRAGTETLGVGFLQLETGSVATSPITTVGSAVTRNRDSDGYVGTGNINRLAGTVVCTIQNIAAAASNSPVLFDAQGNAGADDIQVYLNGSGLPVLYISSGGATQATITGTTDCRGTTKRKIAATWTTNEAKLYVDGVQEGATDTSVTVPAALTSMTVGAYSAAPYELGGNIKDLKIYGSVLSASQVAAL